MPSSITPTALPVQLTIQLLRDYGVLPVKRLAQLTKIRVEGNKTCGSLEERFSSGVLCKPIQRALAITCCQPIVTS